MHTAHLLVVNPDHVAGSIGILSYWSGIGGTTTTLANTGVFGFTYAAGHLSTGPSFWAPTWGNVTDTSATDQGSVTNLTAFGATVFAVDLMPGATHSHPLSSATWQ
jgi:hypothetical protein